MFLDCFIDRVYHRRNMKGGFIDETRTPNMIRKKMVITADLHIKVVEGLGSTNPVGRDRFFSTNRCKEVGWENGSEHVKVNETEQSSAKTWIFLGQWEYAVSDPQTTNFHTSRHTHTHTHTHRLVSSSVAFKFHLKRSEPFPYLSYTNFLRTSVYSSVECQILCKEHVKGETRNGGIQSWISMLSLGRKHEDKNNITGNCIPFPCVRLQRATNGQ